MNYTLQELYMMSHSNYRIAILFGTKSCWMDRNKLLYIIRFLCLCYVHIFTISSWKVVSVHRLGKKGKKKKKKRNCKFFLFFVGTCLACSVSICDGLYVLLEPINASLLLPTFNENQSSNRVVECKKTVPCCFSTGDLWKKHKKEILD